MGIYITFFVALFVITNPIGNLVIFSAITSNRSAKEQKKIAFQSAIAIMIILVIVTWAGNLILSFFGISPDAFETAGALVLLLLGISMINGHSESKSGHSNLHYSKEENEEAKEKENVSVVPLAMPLVAGPGAITTIIINAHKFHTLFDKFMISGICILIAFIIFVFFYFSDHVSKSLGVSGVKVMTRIMGLVLMAMAFSMFGHGLIGMFPGLG